MIWECIPIYNIFSYSFNCGCGNLFCGSIRMTNGSINLTENGLIKHIFVCYVKRGMKKNSFFFLILSLIIPLRNLSQTTTEVIKFRDLVFHNEQEKNAFLNLNEKKDKSDIFNLLYNSYDENKIGDKAGAIQRIDRCVSYLQSEIAGKAEAKKIKIIYNYVHKEFLKVYKLENSFMDIFEKGEFNCVSASALYGVILSKLDIPYQIKETPTHVYILTYPGSGKIMIETTAAQNGYYQFKFAFVNKFVANLYASKLITKEEYESVPANDLFNKYFFASEDISLLQLSGLQYSNFAIYDLDDERVRNANEEVKKAYYIYPDQRHKYILESTLAALITKNGYQDMESVKNLILLSRFSTFKNSDISNQEIFEEFMKIMQTQLINNSEYEKFDQSYEAISSELTDTTLKKEISFAYHYELARLGYTGSKGQDYVLNHLLEAYKLNPLNANLRALIAAAYEKSVRRFSDSKNILETSETFASKFEFLKEADYFLDIKSSCFLDLAYQAYFLADLPRGENYLKEFESFVGKNKSVQPSSELVERAYGQAAGQYYRKGNYTKSKLLLKTGLQYAPQSFGLQQRLNQLKNQ